MVGGCMTALKDVRKHMRSVRKTQKIMRAMKMVSTIRLRRAKDALVAARPYASSIQDVVARLVAHLSVEEMAQHPLLRTHAVPHRVMLVVMSSDRGLAGTFNSNVTRAAERFLWEEQSGGPPPAGLQVEKRRNRRFSQMRVVTIGRKAAEHFSRRDVELAREHSGLFEPLTFDRATAVATSIMEAYAQEDLHAAFLVYNEFKSVLGGRVVVEQLLPIVPEGCAVLAEPVTAQGAQRAFGQGVRMQATPVVFEPGLDVLLQTLLPAHFATRLYHAALESSAAEHAARMMAMDVATKNAGKLLDHLTMKYNRGRQALITKELMEVIGGAEALK